MAKSNTQKALLFASIGLAVEGLDATLFARATQGILETPEEREKGEKLLEDVKAYTTLIGSKVDNVSTSKYHDNGVEEILAMLLGDPQVTT